MTSSKGVGLAVSKVVPRFKGPVLTVGFKRAKAGLGSGCALPAQMGLQSEGARLAVHAASIHSDHLRVRKDAASISCSMLIYSRVVVLRGRRRTCSGTWIAQRGGGGEVAASPASRSD